MACMDVNVHKEYGTRGSQVLNWDVSTSNLIPAQEECKQDIQNVVQTEVCNQDSTVSCQSNIIFEQNRTATNVQTIEILDDLGNVINTIDDLNVTTQKELEEQHLFVTLTQNDVEYQAQKPTETSKLKPRKRKVNSSEWKINVRKRKCQSGEEYVNVRGKVVKARRVQNKKNCLQNCKFNCAKQISEDERQEVFQSYWSLTQNEKYVFLKNTTKKLIKGRKTTGNNDSRRCYSFTYFLQVKGEDIRVCKAYFLGTLNISQKPIYTAHLEVNQIKKDNRGKQSKASAKKEEIKSHINRFPVIDSHYCRRTTKRKYLEANLSVVKMYDLYTKWCNDNDISPAKLSYYRYIFTTEFNYGFHVPKKDRCIKCESFKIKKQENVVTSEEKDYQEHIELKNQMRIERTKDREGKVPTLCFDLENVITCPRTEVGNFFYFQKLNIYNLTAHLSTTKQIYCAIWTEAKQGRSGNILASAFRKILDQVLNENNITDLITWSDSCVSQNRNSFISFAVIDAMRHHPEVNSVTMKYSVPGHGAIQEVDNAHSNIERYMNKTEFYSPLSFIKNLKSVNTKKPYCILQMRDEDFIDYEACSKKLSFNKIPFSKVASL
ncbi:hypothetical protein FQR65_LT14372 [Abscondita terminalis]|nr:hypothetical protein FQR65_LT14372 [Abscondita terminalis]